MLVCVIEKGKKMAKSSKEYSDKFHTIRIRVEDYNTLLEINEKTQIPIVGLVHLAIPMLERKFRVVELPKGE